MNIIHSIWLPQATQDFIQSGTFYLWIESDESRTKVPDTVHPQHLTEKPCLAYLTTELALAGIKPKLVAMMPLLLPTYAGKPLPSPELQAVDMDGEVTLQTWQVYAYPLPNPLKTINNIHFLSCYQVSNVRLGGDFLFWYWFSQFLKQFLAKDQYLPMLLSQKSGKNTHFYRRWQVVSSGYERLIQRAVVSVPLVCSQHYQAESLLRHFAEVLVDDIVAAAAKDMPEVFVKKVRDDFLETMLFHKLSGGAIKTCQQVPDEFAAWQQWQQKLLGTPSHNTLQLGLQLLEADVEHVDQWGLVFFLSSQQDPSLKIDLADFWAQKSHFCQLLQQDSGATIEQQILVNLAQAARIYPKLWQGMEGSEPDSVQLSLDEAFEFLQESAWLLEDAGFKVIIPAWLTPKGRHRAKISMRTGKSISKSASAKGYFSMDTLTDYQYELALGDETLSSATQPSECSASLKRYFSIWDWDAATMARDRLDFLNKCPVSNSSPQMSEKITRLAQNSGFYRGKKWFNNIDDYRNTCMPIDTPPELPPQLHERIVCSIAASVHYDVPANILLAVAEKEAGKPGQWVRNKNRTHDVGAMQFNTGYLKSLTAQYGITAADVATSGCYAYDLAAWRLHGHLLTTPETCGHGLPIITQERLITTQCIEPI